MGRNSLTPACCRKQETQIVVENYESAVKVLMTHEGGKHYVGPLTVMRAKKQRSICYNELKRRGYSGDELNYVPTFEPHEIDPVKPAEDLTQAITVDQPSQTEQSVHV